MSRGEPDLSVRIGPLVLKNPVLVASGTFGYGDEYAPLLDPSGLGGIVVKSLTLRPRDGAPPPRLAETPAGMLNAIGLQNIGVERFISEKLPFLRGYDTRVVVSVAGETTEEYGELAGRLDLDGVDALEVNISCPNVEKGGMLFGSDPDSAYEVVSAVRRATSKPVIAKLTPHASDVAKVAEAVREAGADAVSLINTLVGMAVDVETRRPKLGNVTGGLSGPAVRPVALALVWKVASAVRIPVIGIGGISSPEDALEFLIVGARAVQVGTATFFRPRTALEVVDGIREYMERHGFGSIDELSGSLEVRR